MQDRGEQEEEEHEEQDQAADGAHAGGVNGVQWNGDDVDQRQDQRDGQAHGQTSGTTHETDECATHEPVGGFFQEEAFQQFGLQIVH